MDDGWAHRVREVLNTTSHVVVSVGLLISGDRIVAEDDELRGDLALDHPYNDDLLIV